MYVVDIEAKHCSFLGLKVVFYQSFFEYVDSSLFTDDVKKKIHNEEQLASVKFAGRESVVIMQVVTKERCEAKGKITRMDGL